MTPLEITTALLTGLMLGGIYFGGLWWTVRLIADSHVPAQLLVLSFVVRIAVLMGGLVLVAQGRWQIMLIALGGVLISRMLMIRFIPRSESTLPQREATP